LVLSSSTPYHSLYGLYKKFPLVLQYLSAYGGLVQSLVFQLYEFAGLIQGILLTGIAGLGIIGPENKNSGGQGTTYMTFI